PPRPSATLQRVVGAPPARSIFFNDVRSKKPRERPSGDQKGNIAFSVPATCRGTAESSARTQRVSGFPGSAAPNTIFVPSGDRTGGAPVNANANSVLSGGRIAVRTTGSARRVDTSCRTIAPSTRAVATEMAARNQGKIGF